MFGQTTNSNPQPNPTHHMQTYYVYTFHSHSYLGTVRAESLAQAQAILDRDLIMPCIVTETAPLDLSNF